MYQLNQSYRQVFVLLGSSILASGTTVDLALGQLGFFDGKTYAATSNPTYANNKALIIGQGRPDLSDLGGAANMHLHGHSDKTKLIKGKSILEWRGSKAKRGQNEVVAIGYDGVNVCKTLSAKCGQLLTVYVRLTGAPITKWFSPQGLIRQYTINTKCATCDLEALTDVCLLDLADELAQKINEDKVLYKTNLSQFVKAEAVKYCVVLIVLPTGVGHTKYTLESSDNDDGIVLAQLQAQYLGYIVEKESRNGVVSTYKMWRLTSAGALASATIKNNFIADCPTCPSGFTLETGVGYYQVTREDNRTDVSTTVATNYGVSNGAVYRLSEEFGQGIYIVKSATVLSLVGTDAVRVISVGRDLCTKADSTIAWVAGETGNKYSKKYCLTLGNDCSTDRLVAVQASYLGLTITKKALASGVTDCANVYETTTLSSLVLASCNTSEVLVFTKLMPFESFDWDECPCDTVTLTVCTDCVAGVILTGAFVDRKTSECAWQPWMACEEFDGIHIEASTANYDYNSDPCEDVNLLVTKLQQFEYPQGTGCLVRKQEIDSQGYELRFWNGAREVMDSEKYQLFSQVNKFYDQYDLVFEFKYPVLGWSDKYTDTYTITFFVLEGQGAALERIVNGYLSSASIGIDLVIL